MSLKSYQGLIHSIAVHWGALKSWMQALSGYADSEHDDMDTHHSMNPRFYKST
jgi:hypothetical protein